MRERVQFMAYKGKTLMLHTWAEKGSAADIEREIYQTRLKRGDFTNVVVSEPGIKVYHLYPSAGERDMSDWKPIATAPRDGTIVELGWLPNGYLETDPVRSWWMGRPETGYWAGRWTPTHWRPLSGPERQS